MDPIAKQVAEQFHAWERRLRGWERYDHHVSLEPPDARFRGYHVERVERTGDGRVPGFLDRLRGENSRRPRRPRRTQTADPLPEPDRNGGITLPVEIQLTLPRSTDVTPRLAARLVDGVLAPGERVAFELMGLGPEVVAQVVVTEENARAVEGAIETLIPDVTLTRECVLLRAFDANPADPTVIADFGLAREFLLPLAAATDFRVDPLLGFLPVLESLEDDEFGLVQVLFEPTSVNWLHRARERLVGRGGEPLFPDVPDLLAAGERKFRSPPVAAAIRIVARSRTEHGARAVARRLAAGFQALSGENELLPLEPVADVRLAIYEDVLGRATRRGGMLLSVAELASIVHPPAPVVRTEDLRSDPTRTAARPRALARGVLRLGSNTHRGRTTAVEIGEAERVRHVHLVGATGTGKSTLLLHMIRQDLEAGRGFALLDPHGDLADDVLGLVPESRIDDVVVFDPADTERPVGFNVLAASSESERALLASDLTAIFRRFSTSWGDQMTAVLSNAVLALLESDVPRTLIDLRRMLSDEDFRRSVVRTLDDPMLRGFWERDFPRLPGARSELPITNRLDAFLRPKSIRRVIAQPTGGLDATELMSNGGALVVRLSQGELGQENAHLLGSLLVSRLHLAALARAKLARADRPLFTLYLDEFQNFLAPSLAPLLSGARKYGVGLVLAHQELRQVRDPEVRGALLANAATRICFRVGSEDARTLATPGSAFDSASLQQLRVGQAVCRVAGKGAPFNLTVDPPPELDVEAEAARRVAVRAASRGRLGEPIDEVDALLRVAWGAPPVPEGKQQRTAAESAETGSPAAQQKPRPTRGDPPPTPDPPRTSGRGGARHKYLQGVVKQAAESYGYRATVEAELEDGGRVDVLLSRGSERIAVEISVTTDTEHELRNVEKCLKAGVDRVLVLVSRLTGRQVLREAVRELRLNGGSRVEVVDAEQLVAALSAATPAATRTVRGYQVSARLAATNPAGTGVPKETVARVIADALKRMARGEP